MKTLQVIEKRGFHCESDGCKLLDQRGLFLEYKKSVNFNLPPGTYMIKSGFLSALPAPVVYALPKLPATEKHNDLTNVQIKEIAARTVNQGGVEIPNPKFCIDVANAEYYYNPDWIKTLTTPQICFAQNHEVGHFFYYDQGKCDIWAEYNMLDMGYNPSQIAFASHNTLCGTCKSKGTLEYLFGLNVPFESATRRLATEGRMQEISQLAALMQ